MSALRQFLEQDVIGQVVSFWRWWTDELSGMLPERVRALATGGPTATILPLHASVEIERVIDDIGERLVEGAALEQFDDGAWAELDDLTQACKTRLLLKPPIVFCMELDLPSAARRNINGAVAVQLPFAAPLDPDSLVWKSRIIDGKQDALRVEVVMAKRAMIEQIQTLFEDRDMRIPPIDGDSPNGRINLSGGEERPRDPERTLKRRLMLAALLLILSIPLSTLFGAKLLADIADDHSAALAEQLAPKLVLERNWHRNDGIRRALLPFVRLEHPTDLVEELAKTLPKSAFVETVAFSRDRSLEVRVNTSDPKAVVAALAGSTKLKQLSLVDQALGDDQRLVAVFRARAQ